MEKVCLLMMARRLVLTRMESGVSTSILHLVRFSCPVLQKQGMDGSRNGFGNAITTRLRVTLRLFWNRYAFSHRPVVKWISREAGVSKLRLDWDH